MEKKKIRPVDADELKQRAVKYCLCDEELNAIEALKLEDYKELEARRIFFVMACTGAKLSDAIKLDYTNINTEQKCVFYENYRGKDVSIPLSKRIVYYLTCGSYFQIEDKSLKHISAVLSRALKSVLVKAGFGIYAIECISMSSARTTFATRLFNSGVNEKDIMELMGIVKKQDVLKHIVGYNRKRLSRQKLSKIISGL